MSAVIEVNQSQVNAVIDELEIVKKNVNVEILPATERFMGEVQDVAIDLTHYITHALQSGWLIRSSNSGGNITVTLYNPVDYAKEEFDRPGVKKSVGTSHDVRPEIQDMALANIEQVIFKALIRGLG